MAAYIAKKYVFGHYKGVKINRVLPVDLDL